VPHTFARPLWVLAAVALFALGSTAIQAVTQETVINACVDKGSALIRSIDPGDECRKNERAISWNVQGPQGDPGPAGPPGLSGVEMVVGEAKKLPTGVLGPNVTVSAACPEGKVALSGGATANVKAAVVMLGSPVVPAGDLAPTGWTTYVTMASGGALPASANIVATAYAMCASAD
jgi:hypothetical protein